VLQFCRSLGCPFEKRVGGRKQRSKVSKFQGFRVSRLKARDFSRNALDFFLETLKP
jgi:hypothetical protein